MLSTLPILIALSGAASNEVQPAAAITPAPTVAPAAAVDARSSQRVEPALVRTDDKLELRGDFFPPRKASGRVPAVLLLHDAGSDRASVAKLAESLARANYGVLALDLRGHGESATDDVNWSATPDEERNSIWTFALRDVKAGAHWLSEQDELHSTNLTVIGVGASGALAVHHAIDDSNVRAVGLIGFEQECFGFDLGEDLLDLEGLPVSITTAKDERTDAKALVEDLEAEEWIELNTTRATREKLIGDKRAVRDLVDWVDEHTQPRRGARG